MNKKYFLLNVLLFLFGMIFVSCEDTVYGSSIGSKSSSQGYEVGDVIYTDGTSDSFLTDKEKILANKDKVIALIFKSTTENEKALGLGLDFSLTGLSWCAKNTSYTNERAIPTTISYENNKVGDHRYSCENVSGNVSGKEALERIMARFSGSEWKEKGHKLEELYPSFPAFEYCYNYKNYCDRIAYSRFQDGWYLPSCYELNLICNWNDKMGSETITKTIAAITDNNDIYKIAEEYILSCSLPSDTEGIVDSNKKVYLTNFYTGLIIYDFRTETKYPVLAIHEF